jgi:hypothetical protein
MATGIIARIHIIAAGTVGQNKDYDNGIVLGGIGLINVMCSILFLLFVLFI